MPAALNAHTGCDPLGDGRYKVTRSFEFNGGCYRRAMIVRNPAFAAPILLAWQEDVIAGKVESGLVLAS